MNKFVLRQSLLLLLTATIWGVAFVAQSVGMDYVGPFTFNVMRSIIGGVVLLPCIALLRKINGKGNTEAAKKMDGKERKTLFIGGIACGVLLCIASNLQQFGIMYTSVGKAGFITAFYIIIVPILGLLLGKKCGLSVWISVMIALIGLYFLCITDGFSIGKGDSYVFLGALAFAIHILVIDYFTQFNDGVKMSCIQFFSCGIICFIPMILFEHPEISTILLAWKPILYAGVLSCGVGYTLQMVGQKNMNPTVASLILSLESVISVIAGFLVLHQNLSQRELIGCALMFIAIILAQLPGEN